MTSGVSVHDDCKQRFTEMQMGHKYQYILFRLSDDLREIIVQECGPKGSSYDTLVGHFKDAEARSECRYALFDLSYRTFSGTNKNKILFFAWSPDTARIKQKMVYSSSKDALKKALGSGIAKEVQANDDEELDIQEILQDVRKSDRN